MYMVYLLKESKLIMSVVEDIDHVRSMLYWYVEEFKPVQL
jgi:hypothetical protein